MNSDKTNPISTESKFIYITIGIASYNYGHYLAQAFEAIKQQNYSHYEILYCDDGSTDNSVDIIYGFIKDNPNMEIRLIQGKNKGIIANKNRILKNAHGEYLMICDADDWMEKNCLEYLVYAIKKNCYPDRIVSEIKNVNEEGTLLHIQNIPACPSKWSHNQHHGVLYKMETIFKNHLEFRNIIPDDFDFIQRFNLYATNTVFIHDAIYNWRIHENSVSHNKDLYSNWKSVEIFKNQKYTFKEITNTTLLSPKDYNEFLYEMIKHYYFRCIFNMRYMKKYTQVYTYYQQMLSVMLSCNSDYLNSPLIFGYHSTQRKKTQIAIKIMALSEKLKLCPLLLNTFRIAMKYIYIDM